MKPPIALFDNRAATYTNLGRLKPALRDGKQMIEQDKSNCTGYLRAGKILQLLEKPDTALDIYQLGLRRALPSDPNTKLLQGIRDKLAKQCAPPKAVDPFQVLPIEIVEIIISHLRFKDTVHMLRVSKSWRDLLSSMPRLWANLDFSNAKKNVRLTTVRKYVKNGQGTCSAICFDHFGLFQQNILSYVASRCRGMREVRLLSGFVGASLLKAAPCAVNLQTLIISSQCETTSDTVSQLLQQCVNLERAEFHDVNASTSYVQKSFMPKMHTLVLNARPGFRDVLDFHQLLVQIENICSLTLRNWEDFDPSEPLDFSYLPTLEYLDISNLTTALPPRLPESIRSVDMTKCNDNNYTGIGAPQTYEPPVLPNLSTLLLGHSYIHTPPQAIDIFTANRGGLRVVDISGILLEDQVPSLILDGHLARVEKLKLRENAVGDAVASLIAEKLSELQQLDLARTMVTGVGVKALITGLKGKLEWLGLDECRHTSVDAVELARSMGVKVSYRFPDQRGGKKIRNQT